MKDLNDKLNSILKELRLEDNKENIKKLHTEKSEILQKIKPSTKEDIIYFKNKDLDFIKFGFIKNINPFNIKFDINKRSYLEYNKSQRHPIPYCIIKNSKEDKYFLSLREQNGGEMRLIGKKGLLGGHVAKEDIIKINNVINLKSTIESALYRELLEEAGITKDIIKDIEFKGILKLKGDVEDDHIGYIYEIDLNTLDINAKEKGVLSGVWLSKEEILNNLDSLELWSYAIFKDLFR